MRSMRTHPAGRYLFEAYVAVLGGFVTIAMLAPAVVRAREAARRAVCTNDIRQHSGSHADVVCLRGGRIAWVSSCWLCGSRPDVRICFVEEKDGGIMPSRQALAEGLTVFWEAVERLRQHKLVRGEVGILRVALPRIYPPDTRAKR